MFFPCLFLFGALLYISFYYILCPCCSFAFYISRCPTFLFFFMSLMLFIMFSLFRVTEETVNESEKNLVAEKPVGEDDAADGNKESPVNEPAEKEPEDKVNFSII